MEVPTTSSIEDVYPQEAVAQQKTRWAKLLSSFEQEYGHKPDFVSRSPGRVNIVGEHIDYSLYECLPMAVTADVLLAVSPSSSGSNTVRISNTNSSKFPSRSFDIPAQGELPIDAEAHDWSNYFKAGMRGASELLRKKKGDNFHSVGMDIVVDGTVPAGGGLSSSAAFVCASALAVMKANGVSKVDKTELCEVAIVSERAVGVNSGGMDQAASVFSQRDSGLLIAFKPRLTANPITIPTTTSPGSSLTFLIAQSFVTSNKRVTGPVNYNLRVVECTLAALYLAQVLKVSKPLPQDASPLGQSLRGLHEAYFAEHGDGAVDEPTQTPQAAAKYASQLEKLVQLTGDYMVQEEGYTRAEIADRLGVSVDDLDARYTTKVPVRAERFKLRQRALHVFSEALRVQRFVQALHDDESRSAPDLHQRLGSIVADVQTSCRDDYECSCPELDQLCAVSEREGAFGGRLTGAGWGGCSVHLVPDDKVDAVRKAWIKEYYNVKYPDLSKEDLEDAIIVSKPGTGSMIYDRGTV